MAKSTLSESSKALIERHKAVAGTMVGAEALAELGNISNADPDEAIFQKGDKFTCPNKELIGESVFVARLGTSKVPAMVVDMAGGGSKVLYLSSMRKRVVEYEEGPEGFVSRRNPAGAVISHSVGEDDSTSAKAKALYTTIKNKPTARAIAEEIAGKTFEVKDVLGPFQTSRIGTVKDEYGNESRGVVGLRNTNINVFEEV
jgi:hypothetical protein